MATLAPSSSVPAEPRLSWAALSGDWSFDEGAALYRAGAGAGFSGGRPVKMGVAITNRELQDGEADLHVRFDAIQEGDLQGGGLVVGYRSLSEKYLAVQLAASEAAYSISEFLPAFGWRPIVTAGRKENLRSGRDYHLALAVRGQRLSLRVDDVKIFDQLLQSPLQGAQVGVIAAGESPIHFHDLQVRSKPPVIFVAMQFGDPFDTIYEQVIKPFEKELGVTIFRVDEVARPGVIFQDIQQNIAEAKVVIAEISAPNQNVYYELGYAHALNKPTILLARRDCELPFDIRSYRVIFYDDTIGGKPAVEQSLRKHLRTVLQEL